MWYLIIIFVTIFELAVSIFLPYFPNMTVTVNEPHTQEEQSFWDRLFDTDYIFGTVVLPIEEETSNGTYYGYPEIDADTTSDLISAGYNPFETLVGIMRFEIVGAEALSVIFYLMDFLVLICVIKLIRGA